MVVCSLDSNEAAGVLGSLGAHITVVNSYYDANPIFFGVASPQPIEKSRFGRENPRKSKPIQAFFSWFSLVLFGLAWFFLE
jgi:hypothetical protein